MLYSLDLEVICQKQEDQWKYHPHVPFFVCAESTVYLRKGFYETKIMRILCRQRILLPIVLVLKKSAHVTENAKNASSITTRKATCPTVEDNRLKNHVFSVSLSVTIDRYHRPAKSLFLTVSKILKSIANHYFL